MPAVFIFPENNAQTNRKTRIAPFPHTAPPMRHTRFLIPALGFLLAASSPAAEPPAAAVPVARPAPSAPIPTDDYELRGIFGTGDKLEVSLAKKDAPDSTWIPLGKKRGDIRLEHVSPKEGTAIITNKGRRLLVRLAKEKAVLPTEADIAEGLPAKTLKDLSPEEKQKATEALEAFFNNLSGDQRNLMISDVQQRMASDPVVVATIRNIRASGQAPTGQDMAVLEASMLSHYGETVKKIAALPGNDGVIRPAPEYFGEFIKPIVPRALRNFVVIPNLPEDGK